MFFKLPILGFRFHYKRKCHINSINHNFLNDQMKFERYQERSNSFFARRTERAESGPGLLAMRRAAVSHRAGVQDDKQLIARKVCLDVLAGGFL